MQQDNSYTWTPNSDMSSQVGPMDEDLELFSRLSFTSYLPEGGFVPLVAPLISPPSDISEVISCMNVNDGKQRPSISSNLSLEITPGISITEATPLTHKAPGLALLDDFLNKHFDALIPEQQEEEYSQEYMYQQQEQQQQQHIQLQQQQIYQQQDPQIQQQMQQQFQQQQQQQQHESFTRLMDTSYMDSLLIAEPGQTDWLSWTPVMGSPASNYSVTSFDDQTSIYSTSPEPSYFQQSMTFEDLVQSSSHYPSPSRSDINNTLTVRKPNRSRRVSEPPKPTIVQEQLGMSSSDRSVRRTNSDKRARSNSNASGGGNHHCLFTGCGKSFTRPYNLTSHMRTHTSDRPFACSQCGRKFARQHDRNRHEKLHWGIKPYACGNCKKPFARMDALNRHLRVENGCSSNPTL